MLYWPRMPAPPVEDVLEAAPRSAPRSPLSGWITLGCSLVVGGLVAGFVLVRSPSPLERLDRPEASLERLVTRDMDLRVALSRVPGWERALYSLFAGFEDTPEEAIAWYDELVDTADAPPPTADLQRVILLAEAGQAARARTLIAAAAQADPRWTLLAGWAEAAYAEPPPDAETAMERITEIRRVPPADWFTDTLVARIALRVGDSALASEAESAIAARGASLLWRWRALAASEMALVALGAAALLALRARPLGLPLAGAPLPPPWPLSDGYGLFARGALGFVALGWLPIVLLPDRPGVGAAVAFLAGVPMLGWTVSYLRVRGAPVMATFGLRIAPGAWTKLVRVGVVLMALDIVGQAAITAGGAGLGIRSHWADGFPEELLWDPWWLVAVGSADTVLWTPFVEELAFRGILYASLRTRLAVWPAALASAVVFAVAHGYGAVGGASVLWSGVLWALAYERTRSVWPGVLAHATNNLTVNLTYIWLLRL